MMGVLRLREFGKRQFQAEPTNRQRWFDFGLGMAVPTLGASLVGLFYMLNGVPFFMILITLFFAFLPMMFLLFWTVGASTKSEQESAILAGCLFFSALIAFGLGKMTLEGIVELAGVNAYSNAYLEGCLLAIGCSLGAACAFVYVRNGVRAVRCAMGARRGITLKALLLIMSGVMIFVFPFLVTFLQ